MLVQQPTKRRGLLFTIMASNPMKNQKRGSECDHSEPFCLQTEMAQLTILSHLFLIAKQLQKIVQI